MKTYSFIFLLLFQTFFLFCSQATDANKSDELSSDLIIELLKRIYKLDVDNAWKIEELNYFKRTGEDLRTWTTTEEFFLKVKDENSDTGFRLMGILSLAFVDLDGVESFLLEVLKNAPNDMLRLNAARALAYQGKKDGVELLRQCAAGELVLTSSGFEQHAAALALLMLGERLPQQYLSSPFADPLYVRLAN